MRQVSGHGFIRAVTSLFTPVILTDRERALRVSGSGRTPRMNRITMPRQGVLLETFFSVSSAMQLTLSIASTLNQRRRRGIIEPTLKASACEAEKGG